MKFHTIPLARAEGAVLAHSQPLADGRLLKGQVLTANDLAALKANGIAKVTVAELTAGDVDENTAATRLAEALVHGGDCGLRAGPAAHGATFLYATRAGVLSVKADALTRMNLIDEVITLASLPPYARVGVGQMVASIKIISYGVAAKSLVRVTNLATGALSVAPVQITGAALIETLTAKAKRIESKGQRVTHARLDALGVPLRETVMIRHDEGELAGEIARLATRTDLGMILILTASATSDRRDVAPAALRRAGGKVIRFGMPVDPGHLLFYGKIAGKWVVGLPGCARSPVLNGVDFVIERLACGLPLTPRDFAAMGVGGLLKDTKARGMPRPQGNAGGES